MAIAALVIAGQYRDDNPCEEDDLTIDLVLFLQVAGGIQIAMLLFSFAILWLAKIDETDPAMLRLLGQIGCAPSCGVFIFYIVWGAIGCIMWNSEMSSVCLDEDAAYMAFVWSQIMV